MDWSQLLASLLGALVGGGLVIVADFFRTRRELDARRSDLLVDQYADLLVHFHASLHAHSEFWASVVWAEDNGQNFEPRPEESAARVALDGVFRDALWRVTLREPDEGQRRRLQALLDCFEWDKEDGDDANEFARNFGKYARAVRNQMHDITDLVQRRHRDSLVGRQ